MIQTANARRVNVLSQQGGGLDRWAMVTLDLGMLDAVGRTDQTRVGLGVQLSREGSWWGKGGSVTWLQSLGKELHCMMCEKVHACFSCAREGERVARPQLCTSQSASHSGTPHYSCPPKQEELKWQQQELSQGPKLQQLWGLPGACSSRHSTPAHTPPRCLCTLFAATRTVLRGAA
eukprot:2736218-Rhodomonas_salina.2